MAEHSTRQDVKNDRTRGSPSSHESRCATVGHSPTCCTRGARCAARPGFRLDLPCVSRYLPRQTHSLGRAPSTRPLIERLSGFGMTGFHRARRTVYAALTPVFVLGLAACAGFPDTIFGAHSEIGRTEDRLTYLLLILGGLVFVLVEGALIWALIRFRTRPNATTPQQTHGNTTLEVTWTLIPAVILAVIAVPSVRTIFETQANAAAGSLQVEVIGHQWWWEFRYPQYKITTANELYLPVGRKVNFALKTQDVIHSFSIPRLGGKRDLISNHTNFLWFTPDSIGEQALNGMCAEYCGASHANMRFKVFTVTPENFASWAAHQQTPAAFGAVSAPAPAGTASAAGDSVRSDVANTRVAAQGAGPGTKPATGPAV